MWGLEDSVTRHFLKGLGVVYLRPGVGDESGLKTDGTRGVDARHDVKHKRSCS